MSMANVKSNGIVNEDKPNYWGSYALRIQEKYNDLEGELQEYKDRLDKAEHAFLDREYELVRQKHDLIQFLDHLVESRTPWHWDHQWKEYFEEWKSQAEGGE